MTPPRRPDPPNIEDGFYVEQDDRIPSHPRYRLVPESPRRGCLGWLLLAVVVGWRVL